MWEAGDKLDWGAVGTSMFIALTNMACIYRLARARKYRFIAYNGPRISHPSSGHISTCGILCASWIDRYPIAKMASRVNSGYLILVTLNYLGLLALDS